MKATALILAALAALTATAATEVFRLERDTDTGALAVVGVDNVRRAVQLIDPDEYAVMTGQVAAVWCALNSTDDGRRKLHGKREKTIVDTNAAEVVTVYADGYRWSLSGKFHVLIRGKKAPILGRICMDQLMVDVTEI